MKKFRISRQHAVIKLIEKRTEAKVHKELASISLLNVDYKIMSKALATKLKETLPGLISCQQTTYVKNRFIGEGGRLISDILEISNVFNLRGYIVTVDIEKAFDSLSHSFRLACLEKYGIGHDFIRWVKTLLESQESFIINAGKTTSYFNLDPVSTYLFILCLEVLFLLVKANHKTWGVKIFQYKAYVDDTIFF